jgi:hypothetical protein
MATRSFTGSFPVGNRACAAAVGTLFFFARSASCPSKWAFTVSLSLRIAAENEHSVSSQAAHRRTVQQRERRAERNRPWRRPLRRDGCLPVSLVSEAKSLARTMKSSRVRCSIGGSCCTTNEKSFCCVWRIITYKYSTVCCAARPSHRASDMTVEQSRSRPSSQSPADASPEWSPSHALVSF